MDNPQELEVQIQKLTQELDQLKKAHALFLHKISHDLKTPTHALFHCLNEIMRFSTNEQKLQDLANSGLLQAQELNSLLEQLLLLDSFNTKKVRINRKAFNLVALLESKVDYLRRSITENKFANLETQLVWNFPHFKTSALVGDRDKIEKIIDALLMNSVKNTREGFIKIIVNCLEEGPNNIALEIKIEDTGQGMTSETLSQVFTPFAQYTDFFHGETNKLGLSLMLCERMIKLMSGHFEITSSQGRGTQVSIKLGFPVEKSSPYISREIPSTNLMVNTPQPILIVDDNIVNRNILCAIARRLGFETKTAKDGHEAIELYSKYLPSLIFLDCQMPVMNGFETCSYLRKIKQSNTPIIAITANTSDEDIQKCYESGMDDVLSKPVTPHRIAEVLSSWIGQESVAYKIK